MVEAIAVIAIYDFHARAKDAVRRLRKSSLDMRQLSIVGLDRPGVQRGIVDYNSGCRTRSCAERDAFWAEVRGELTTAPSFGIPGVGLVLVR